MFKRTKKNLPATTYQLKTNHGVTLVEMIITVGVMAILFSMVFARFKDYDRLEKLRSDSKYLGAALRQIQLFAYTGKLIEGERPSGYGIHFNSGSQYVIFSDSASAGTQNVYDPGVDSIVEEYNMQSGITVSGSPVAIMNLDIVFDIPDGPIFVNATAPNPDQIFTFTDSHTSGTKEVIVNGVSGQVDVD